MAGLVSGYQAGRTGANLASRPGTPGRGELPTVKRAVASLVKAGLLAVVYRGSFGGGRRRTGSGR